MLHRIESARVCGSHSLMLRFDDGTSKKVDLLPLLEGPIFEPVRDPDYFRSVVVDAVAGTVVWPNGADIAPEVLYELPEE